jgi:asparagine synthase (glutamine-hydrolysing)
VPDHPEEKMLMPGIFGIIGGGDSGKKEAMLHRMAGCLLHEPFYESGTFVNQAMGIHAGWVGLKGSFSDCLPVWNEAKDICLIFAGEHFADHDEIVALQGRGHRFDPGNASCLVHLYEDTGQDFFRKLNGRFSGLLVDLRDASVVLFNDRYGLNRIYVHESRDGFYFSSEAKSLLTVLPGTRQLDPEGLAETFSCGCVLQNRTLFKGLSLLPGGSAWKFVSGQNPRKAAYFKAEDWEDQEILHGEGYYEVLKETWERILPRYLEPDRQVGVSLTGGKDSRMIMAWARPLPGTLPCYTFGGMYRECEDVKLARKVAGICQQPHQVISVDRTFFGEFPNLAEQTVYLTDGSMDVSASPDLFVNRIARQIAPIRLTGNYGQEVLRGAIAFKPAPVSLEMLEPGFAETVKRVAETYRSELGPNKLSFVAFKQVPWHHYSRLALELSQLTLRSPFLDNDLVALVYRAPAEMSTSVAIQLRLISDGNAELGKVGTDRGLLYRSVPFLTRLQHQFKQFTFLAEYAYSTGMPHWLARVDHVFEPLHLERLFLGRHKFFHFRLWYRDELSEYVKEILLDPRTLRRSYLSAPRLEQMVLDHVKGTRNYTSEIHKALTCELLQRRLID